jgi:hypothetical protein
MPAPKINSKHARSPGNFPGAAWIGNSVTGLFFFMQNTALDALVASSGDKCTSFPLPNFGIYKQKRESATNFGHGPTEATLCAEHHFMWPRLLSCHELKQ